jgi:tRNA-modifying protein YgfZ
MLQLPERAVIALHGPDTLALLERTVTHAVAEWADGHWRYGGLLTPQGKLIADYLALRSGNEILMDVHAGAADDLVARLKLFRLRADVQIARDPARAVVSEKSGDDDPRKAGMWWREIVPAARVTATLDAARYHTVRIDNGVPEWGADYLSGEVFATDINMDILGGIDYRKGCFVGQEVSSRMKRKGSIRKRTLRVAGAGVARGAALVCGVPIGTVTSCIHEKGLALIRIDRLAAQTLAGEALLCGGEPVRVLTDVDDWASAEIGAFYVD